MIKELGIVMMWEPIRILLCQIMSDYVRLCQILSVGNK